jgi:hypothetical protein
MHGSARVALGLLVVCFVTQPARALTLVSQARQVHALAEFIPVFLLSAAGLLVLVG